MELPTKKLIQALENNKQQYGPNGLEHIERMPIERNVKNIGPEENVAYADRRRKKFTS